MKQLKRSISKTLLIIVIISLIIHFVMVNIDTSRLRNDKNLFLQSI